MKPDAEKPLENGSAADLDGTTERAHEPEAAAHHPVADAHLAQPDKSYVRPEGHHDRNVEAEKKVLDSV